MTNTCTLGGLLLDIEDGISHRAVTDMTGWDNAAGIRPGSIPKSQQDGSWDGTGLNAERVIDLAGFVEEATPAVAHQTRQQLAALRPNQLQELVVDSTSIGTLSAWTRVTIGAKVTWFGETAFEWTLQVVAPDPLKYGAPTFGTATLSTATPGAGRVYPLAYPLSYGIAPGTTPGAVSVANTGTASYWPRLRIDGPVLNPVVTVVETGAWVRYNGSLVAGQWLDLDMAARSVLLQGQVSVRNAVSWGGDWLSVPPGGGSVVWTADTSDPAALLSVWGYSGAWS